LRTARDIREPRARTALVLGRYVREEKALGFDDGAEEDDPDARASG